jgi:signal transduction histidine kinase
MSLLRGGGEERGTSSSRDVHELVEQARGSGLRVQLEVTGSPPPSPGSTVEAFAYRIVQEALTNARKHAPGTSVTVSLRHDPHDIAIRVQDDGPAGAPKDLAALGAGQGLVGMRERVAMVGGRLQAGPNPSGGFLVEAILPREAAA